MKMRFCVRTILASSIGAFIMVSGQSVLAQSGSVATFDRTLETLRQSVAGLVKENQAINAENIAMRARIKGAQEALRSLQAEAQRLEVKKAAEMQRNQNHSGGVDALKAQVAQVDGTLNQARSEFSAEREKFQALQQEQSVLEQKADALSAEISAMSMPGASSNAVRKDLDALKAQQGVLQRQLLDAVNKVQQAKLRWQDANAVVTTGPEQLAALKVERDALAKTLPQSEADLTKLSNQVAEMQSAVDRLRAEDYSDIRAGRLDSEVKDMAERNRKLEVEILALTKAGEEKLKRFEDDKEKIRKQYEAKQEDLSGRNAALKSELNSLRKQMVDLDKKKAVLEASIYPAR